MGISWRVGKWLISVSSERNDDHSSTSFFGSISSNDFFPMRSMYLNDKSLVFGTLLMVLFDLQNYRMPLERNLRYKHLLRHDQNQIILWMYNNNYPLSGFFSLKNSRMVERLLALASIGPSWLDVVLASHSLLDSPLHPLVSSWLTFKNRVLISVSAPLITRVDVVASINF